MRLFKLTLLSLFLTLPAQASTVGPLFTYEGVLTDNSGTPITASQTVTFQVIYSGSCIVYSETQSITPDSNGNFSVIVGSGTRTDTTSNTADRIFASSGSVDCDSASAQTVSGFATRNLHIRVGSTDLSPDVVLNYVPVAMNAQRLNDKQSSDFILKQDVNSNTSCNSGSFLTWDSSTQSFGCSAQSTSASPTGSAGGDLTGNYPNPTLAATGVTAGAYSKVSVDSKGRVLAGSSLTATDIPSLTWSKITSGLPTTLSGYGITDAVQNLGGTPAVQTGSDSAKPASPSTGTLYFATDTAKIYQYNGSIWAVMGAAATGSITDLTGDVSATGPGSVAATVNSVGSSTAANIHLAEVAANAATSSNTANTLVKRDSSGNFVAGTITHAANTGDTYNAASGGNGVTLQGPSGSIASSYVLKLPTSQGGAGQTLSNDGSGNLSWVTPSGGSGTVTSVTAGTGLTGGTITASGTLAVDVGTTANKIVQLDASAKLPAVDGSALTNLNASNLSSGTLAASLMPAFTGDVTSTAGSTATTLTKIQGSPLTLSSLASGHYLKYNGTAWVNTTPSSGDLSDYSSLLRASQMPANCSAGQTLTFSSPTGTWSCTSIVVTAANFGSQTANTFLAAPNGSAGSPTFRTIASTDLPAGTVTGSGSAGYVPYYSAASVLANSSLYQVSGNIGIGTTSPAALLDVKGSTSGTVMKAYNDASSGTAVSISSTGVTSYALKSQAAGSGSIAGYFDASSTSSSGVAGYFNGSGVYSALFMNGNVGIGTTAPRSLVDLAGGTLLSAPAKSNSGTAIDFSLGNLQYTAQSCGSFIFNNLKDGGSYMFVVKGATSAICAFTAYSDMGSTALTVHMPPDLAPTISGKHTVFNMSVLGTDLYVAWTPGY